MPYLGKCDTCTCVHMVIPVIQWLTCVWPFVTPWITARQAPLSSTISRSLLRFMTIESVMASSHLFLCCPLLLLSSIFPSIRFFSNNSSLCIGWPKCRSFNFYLSNEYSGLISFRIDSFELLAVQGTPLKNFLQHCS